MAFVVRRLTDRLGRGDLWFLHDTNEQNAKHRFRSTVFGQSAGNSICVNTHIQALTVLHRLWHLVPNKQVYQDNFDKGMAALRRVLEYQPGTLVYRPLEKLLMEYFQNATQKNVGWARIRKGIKGRAVLMIYGWLKRFFPRLVLPQGFIDRDLTLSVGSDQYQIINLKDLLTLYQQEPVPWLRPYITGAFGSGYELVRRWGLEKAVRRSPYYFEFMDVLHLYNRLIDPLPPQEISRIEAALQRSTGGYSLDFYASHLVRGKDASKPAGVKSTVS
jgi:hypothetical protein